jgi:O-antigen/teichoic acid export membrane protein
MKELISKYHGLSWVGILRIAIRLISFFRLLILGRILLPSQFGTYAIVALVLTLFETLTEVGTNIFLVQQKDEKTLDKYINTVWSMTIIRGILISLLMLSGARYVSLFFKSSEAEYLLYIGALIPLIRGFINPSIAKFQKYIRFDTEFKYKLCVYLTDAGTSVFIAVLTHNPVALIYGLIVGAIVEVFLSMRMVKPNPVFQLEAARTKIVFRKGRWITLSGIFDYLFQNIDDIFVAKILGSHYLGIYQVAYKISSLPTTEVSEVVTRVTFPVYKININSKDRLMAEFRKFTIFSVVLVLTVSILIFIFAKFIILFTLGSSWLEAVLPLRILVAYGAIKSIFYPMMSMFLAYDKQEYITVVTFTGVLGIFLTIYPLTLIYGVAGAAYSALAGVICTVPVILYYLNKLKVFKND